MRKVYCFLLSLILTACATLGVGFVVAKGEPMTTYVNESFNSCAVTKDFTAGSTGMAGSFLGGDARIKISKYPTSVNGSACVLASRMDYRFWSLAVRDNAYRFDLSVKLDENFSNELSYSFSTNYPGNSGKNSSPLVLFNITPNDIGGAQLTTGQGAKIADIEAGKQVKIQVFTTRGKAECTIKIDDKEYESVLAYEMYDVTGLFINIYPRANLQIENPYIMIDDLALHAFGKSFPQKYSLQEVGEFKDIELPPVVETEGYTVYANSTELLMQYPPEMVKGELYIDLEQLAYCFGVDIAGIDTTKSDAPIKLHGRQFVPLRFINEVFNAKVWQDDEHEMVVLTFGERKNDGILRKIGNTLYMNGEPYYEVSFNKFDLFYQLIAKYNGDMAYPTEEYQLEAAKAALSQLRELGFKTIRTFVYSSCFADLMQNEEHKATYLAAMDQFFDLLDEYDIKVVVCMGLVENHLISPDYVEGEGYIGGIESIEDYVANPNSPSRQNVYDYIDLIVNRYKDRKSVLMWEIRNEAGLEADIGFTVNKVKYSLGQLSEFYASCADRIRANDNTHLISSGDATLRNAQWHLYVSDVEGRGNDWTTDNAEERLKALYLMHKSFDVLSTHPYGLGTTDTSMISDENGVPTRLTYAYYMEEAERLGKALYNGECNSGLDLSSPDFYKGTQAYLDEIISAGVQLTHWWTFRSDRQGFNDGYLWTISDGQLLDMLVDANKTIKERWCVNHAASANVSTADPSLVPFDINNLNNGEGNITKGINPGIIAGVGIGAGALAAGAAALIISRKKKKK